MDYQELIISIIEEVIDELHITDKALKKSMSNHWKKHREALSNATKKTDEVDAKEKQDTEEAKKMNDNNSFQDKLRYIKETIATMMDVQPIQVIGKEHPAKEEKKKKCQAHTEPC